VHTSDRFAAGTDADVQIGFQHRSASFDRGYTLDHHGHNDFERGSTANYDVHAPIDYDHLDGICIGVADSSGGGDAWHCGYVEVRFVNAPANAQIKGLRLNVNHWLEYESDYGYPRATCCGKRRNGQSPCEIIS
jgi:hypothetical protein